MCAQNTTAINLILDETIHEERHKCQLHGGGAGKVGGSPKLLGFILWG